MAKPAIITVANQKGGVGKTTTVANLAASLADRGKLVLVIDCDYQANVTSLLCGDEQVKLKEKSITYAIKNDLTIDEVLVGTPFKNIDLVPSNRELDDLREQLVGQPNQFKLIELLLNGKKTCLYDVILIDTHPSLDCFFQSAIAASAHFLIPLFPEADSSRGLAHQLQVIEKVKKYLNPKLNFLGCTIVKYDRYNATHQKFEKLIRQFGKENGVPVMKSMIPNSQSVAAAAAHGLPLVHYKRESPAAKAYNQLAIEVIKLVNSEPKILPTKSNKAQEIEVSADL
jgi:chromosome partitioning protein